MFAFQPDTTSMLHTSIENIQKYYKFYSKSKKLVDPDLIQSILKEKNTKKQAFKGSR
jgi:hypothetical protein